MVMNVRKVITSSTLEAWETGEVYQWFGYDCVFNHLVVCRKNDDVLVIASETLWKILEDYYSKVSK